MPRYYSLDRTMLEAANDQERVRAGLIEGLMNPTEEQLEQGFKPATEQELAAAKRIVHRKGMDRAPGLQNLGRQAQEGVIANEHVYVDESHRNAHGDVVTTVLRRNGPHLERVRVREQQVGEHTYAVTEHFGRR